MKHRNVLGYVVATLTFTFGILILFGYLLTPETSEQFRLALGIVLILFGIYRGSLLYVNAKRKNKDGPPAASEQ